MVNMKLHSVIKRSTVYRYIALSCHSFFLDLSRPLCTVDWLFWLYPLSLPIPFNSSQLLAVSWWRKSVSVARSNVLFCSYEESTRWVAYCITHDLLYSSKRNNRSFMLSPRKPKDDSSSVPPHVSACWSSQSKRKLYQWERVDDDCGIRKCDE